jgi:hypothetical protein
VFSGYPHYNGKRNHLWLWIPANINLHGIGGRHHHSTSSHIQPVRQPAPIHSSRSSPFDPPNPDHPSTCDDPPCGMLGKKIVQITRVLPYLKRYFVRKQNKTFEQSLNSIEIMQITSQPTTRQ